MKKWSTLFLCLICSLSSIQAIDETDVFSAKMSAAIANADIKYIQSLLSAHNNKYIYCLADFYEQAIANNDLTFLSRFEQLLSEGKSDNDETHLESMIEDICAPETLKKVLDTGKISHKCMQRALSFLFSFHKEDLNYLELAQILIDHGGNPLEDGSIWRTTASKCDFKDLEFLMSLPQFDPNMAKTTYAYCELSKKYSEATYFLSKEICDNEFDEEDDDDKDRFESKYAKYIEELGAYPNFCKSHSLVPSPDEIKAIIDNSSQKDFLERIALGTFVLPFVECNPAVAPSTMSIAIGDFIKVSPIAFLGYPDINEKLLSNFWERLPFLNFDPQVLAEIILRDAFTFRLKTMYDYSDESEEDKEISTYDHYFYSAQRSYSYNQLLQDPRIKQCLIELPFDEKSGMDGRTCYGKIRELNAKVVQALGHLPWEVPEEDEQLEQREKIFQELGKAYFVTPID